MARKDAPFSLGALEDSLRCREDDEDHEERLAELARQVFPCAADVNLAKLRAERAAHQRVPNAHPSCSIARDRGKNEDATRLPFVEKTSKLLDDILAAMDLTQQQIYLTDVVKLPRATIEEDDRMKIHQPKTDEIRPCNTYLTAQMEAGMRGGRALPGSTRHKDPIIDEELRIAGGHGTSYDMNGMETMATFHPAFVLRQRSNDLTNTKRRRCWRDMQNVCAECQKAIDARVLYRRALPWRCLPGSDDVEHSHTEFRFRLLWCVRPVAEVRREGLVERGRPNYRADRMMDGTDREILDRIHPGSRWSGKPCRGHGA